MADSDLASKILQQVEYYFGDINLPQDTFLKKTLVENKGWVPFDILMNFKKLRQLSTDIDVIKDALAKSELIEVKENALRRAFSKPAPECLSEALTIHGDKALYVKGFPAALTLDEIIPWLESVAGETYDVFCNKKLKGSIYVTFKEKEAAEKFIASSDCAEYKGSPLLRKWYKNFLEDKIETKKIKDEERNKRKDRRRAKVVSKMTAGVLLEISLFPSLTFKTEELNTDTQAVEDSNSKPDDDDDSVIDRTVSRLRLWLIKLLDFTIGLGWVDFDPLASKAIVRFIDSKSTKAAVDQFKSASEGGKMVFDGSQVSYRVIEGDEEIIIWRDKILKMPLIKKSKVVKFGNKRRRN